MIKINPNNNILTPEDINILNQTLLTLKLINNSSTNINWNYDSQQNTISTNINQDNIKINLNQNNEFNSLLINNTEKIISPINQLYITQTINPNNNNKHINSNNSNIYYNTEDIQHDVSLLSTKLEQTVINYLKNKNLTNDTIKLKFNFNNQRETHIINLSIDDFFDLETIIIKDDEIKSSIPFTHAPIEFQCQIVYNILND
jgi:hypothetical protein